MRPYWSDRPAKMLLNEENTDMAYRISGKSLVLIGKKMRKIRKEQKKRQIDIAVDAGIDGSYYARIERGEANPSLEVLNAIVKALHVKSSEILPF